MPVVKADAQGIIPDWFDVHDAHSFLATNHFGLLRRMPATIGTGALHAKPFMAVATLMRIRPIDFQITVATVITHGDGMVCGILPPWECGEP